MVSTVRIMNQFCKLLPKVELHAHVNGSISNETVLKVLKEQSRDTKLMETIIMRDGQQFELEDAFSMFGVIHMIMNNEETVKAITKDVIADFMHDNVRYLELRSTPRSCPGTGMTTRGYVGAIVAAITECSKTHSQVRVRLLLSIDRTQSVQEAQKTVCLAGEMLGDGVVVGVDLSGNPCVGDARHFLPVLQSARDKGLKISMHLAETPNNEEVLDMVQFLPDRIGHGTYMLDDRSTQISDCVSKNRIPLEVCLTSNVKCNSVSSYGDHHFKHWYRAGHPCILGTDDKGVFQTTLSHEYLMAANSFNLTKQELWELSYNSINHCFVDDQTKQELRELWMRDKEQLLDDKVP